MTQKQKVELFEFLKENLKCELKTEGGGNYLSLSITLWAEEICKDEVYIGHLRGSNNEWADII